MKRLAIFLTYLLLVSIGLACMPPLWADTLLLPVTCVAYLILDTPRK